MIKNYFRILKKPHAYLQTILKAPVQFQKDRTETVGGVKGTKYLLKTRNHAPRATPHGKPKTVSLHFSSKRRGTKKAMSFRTLLLFRLRMLYETPDGPEATYITLTFAYTLSPCCMWVRLNMHSEISWTLDLTYNGLC